MSQTYSYTFYLPSDPGKAAIFGIDFKKLPPPQSQVYQLMQATRQIQSTPYKETALGLGTASTVKTTIVDQQGQVNYLQDGLLNFNGEANGKTGGDIPPKGVLALCFSLFNITPVPTSISFSPYVIVPPGQDSVTVKGVVNTALCSGAYFGAVGIAYVTQYPDRNIPYKYEVTYTLPSP